MCASVLNFIKKLFVKEPDPIPIITYTDITYGDLWDLLKAKFPDAQIWLSDMDYRLCSGEYIDNALAIDDTNRQTYVNEKFDCDDFAYRLMGQLCVPETSDLAFGIVWTDVHALNLFIDNQKKIWFVEPQSDGRKVELENWQGSKIVLVVM
jgi:hypothetical protein